MPTPSAKSAIQVPPYEASRLFAGLPLTHGFFGRRGGVSAGVYDSLNMGVNVGDDPACVAENAARVAGVLGVEAAARATLVQTHSATCHIVGNFDGWTPPEGDALATATPGIALCVQTADCAPVLFAANGVIGAAHAGWGGALKGVLEATVDAMEKLGAGRGQIRAAVGPCIAQASYEVSAGFETPFLKEDEAAERFFKSGARTGKLMFDLAGYCAYRLARAGVQRVDITGHDTCAMADRYFSHRRMTLAGETKRGVQVSAISLKRS